MSLRMKSYHKNPQKQIAKLLKFKLKFFHMRVKQSGDFSHIVG